MDQTFRIVAIAETILLLGLGAWLYGLLAGRAERAIRWLLLVAGYVILGGAIATAVNILSPYPPTPGVKFYAVYIAPAVAALALLAWRTRHR